MSRVFIKALSFLTLSSLVGCGGVDEMGSPDEEVAQGDLAITTTNALTPNALTPNALTPNALSPLDLAAAPLAEGSLQPSAAAAITEPGASGELSRGFLRYAVGCALPDGASFDFSWKDDDGVIHEESYAGLLGLAPRWAKRPLTAEEQRWVSACLIARVNKYGVSVTISTRGAHPGLGVDEAELAGFGHREGAFWGNLFARTPTAYACYYEAEIAHARAQHRACAAGEPDGKGCGMIEIVGACEDHCKPFDEAETWYPKCHAKSSAPSDPITVWLP